MAFKIEEFLGLKEAEVLVEALLVDARFLKSRLSLARKHFAYGGLQEGMSCLVEFYDALWQLELEFQKVRDKAEAISSSVRSINGPEEKPASGAMPSVSGTRTPSEPAPALVELLEDFFKEDGNG